MAGASRQGAQSIGAASAEILATVSEHTASANEQSAAVNQVTATVNEVRAAAEQTAGKAGDVVGLAQASVRVGQEGTESVEAMLAGMAEIRAKVEAIAGDVLALSERSQQIGEPFRLRLLVLFLSLLDVPGTARGSRRRGMGERRWEAGAVGGVGGRAAAAHQPVAALLAPWGLGQLAEPEQSAGIDGGTGRAHRRGLRHLSDVGCGAGVPLPAPARGG